MRSRRLWRVGKRGHNRGSHRKAGLLMAVIHILLVYFGRLRPLLFLLAMWCYLRHKRDR